MTKREIMKRAHEIAKKLEGHYSARLVIALRQAWKEAKAVKELKLSDLPALQGTESHGPERKLPAPQTVEGPARSINGGNEQ